MQNLSRFHYLKEVYLDSATTMIGALRACRPRPTPSNPLPLAEAAETVNVVNDLADSRRSRPARLRDAEPRTASATSAQDQSQRAP